MSTSRARVLAVDADCCGYVLRSSSESESDLSEYTKYYNEMSGLANNLLGMTSCGRPVMHN
jgi:hypothetical protein